MWTESARAGLHEVLDFLDERSPAAAGRFAVRVLDRFESLRIQPWTAPVWRPASDPSFRRLVVDDIIVIYRVLELDQKIVLLTIRHGRRRPITPQEVDEE